MKYGQTLSQRSIPEWASYNVDYNDIKHLIKTKTATAPGQPRAIAIPGRSEDREIALSNFEDELFAELLEQHQRIDLFVKSKSGEIKRRLDHLHEQVCRLARRDFPVARNKLPVSHLEKWSKVEEEVLRAGEEIQALSRFVGAQRLAFQKLLKKYRKWTSSSSLETRFAKEVLGDSPSFSNQAFESLLAQWERVLVTVRAPFDNGVMSDAGSKQNRSQETLVEGNKRPPELRDDSPLPAKGGTSAAQLHSVAEAGSDTDFDTALALCPLSNSSSKATYWVHVDHIVELQVLLLQYTRLRVTKQQRRDASNSVVPSSAVSSHESVENVSMGGEADDEAGILVCDDLKRFAKDQSKATVGDVEHGPGRVPENALVSVRWNSNDEAVVALQDTPGSSRIDDAAELLKIKAKLKQKHIKSLFDSKSSTLSLGQTPSSSGLGKDRQTAQESLSNLDDIRSWLAQHREVHPLVEIRSRRTRFAGLANDARRGTWVSLDRSVRILDPDFQSSPLDSQASLSREVGRRIQERDPSSRKSVNFPHAVLEVRCEGNAEPDLVQKLDRSHLCFASRITYPRHFGYDSSLAYMKDAYKYQLPALQRDIRKLPALLKTDRTRSSMRLTPDSAKSKSNSTSATSITDVPPSSGSNQAMVESSATSIPDQVESPLLMALKKKRKKLTEHPSGHLVKSSMDHLPPKYWNEYDNGDDGLRDEPYTLFVDPNASIYLPGQKIISQITHSILKPLKASANILKSWVSSVDHDDEQAPLLPDYFNQGIENAGADTDNTSSSESHPRRYYSTFPSHQMNATASHRERLLFHTSVGCFMAAILLLILQCVLLSASWTTEQVSLDMGVVIGAIASIGFAMLGCGVMLMRKDRLGWAHRLVVFVTFGIICAVSATLLAIVGGGG
ncbi:MAG: hypothetical protein M1837_004720 [Sclerophora amabilis]|nr:MAG: hypothetical protein M1837_004720 [Sclerophora amabilis]